MQGRRESLVSIVLDDLGSGMFWSWICDGDAAPHDDDGQALDAPGSGGPRHDGLRWSTWREAGAGSTEQTRRGTKPTTTKREREEKETGRTTLELRWQLSSWLLRMGWMGERIHFH